MTQTKVKLTLEEYLRADPVEYLYFGCNKAEGYYQMSFVPCTNDE